MMGKFIKTIWYAGRSLLQHKLRSFLSILGVVCGVMAVLSMISIGEGAKQKIIEQIEQLGTRNIFLRACELTFDQRQKARENLSAGLNPADMNRILVGCSTVSRIGALKEIPATVRNISNELSPEILAVSSNYAALQSFWLSKGRFISDLDIEQKNLVCVLGDEVAKALGPSGKIGNHVRIENSLFKIVGIIRRFERNSDKTSVIPIRNYNEMLFIPLGIKPFMSQSIKPVRPKKKDELSEIVVQVQRTDQVLETAKLIERIIQVSHNSVRDYQIIVPQELLNQAKKTQRTFNIVLGAIAGVSLLVGGIGIMNIMLATVSERTREIGIRRAVGATRSNIIVQFLVESVILTFSGGILGIASGLGAVNLIAIMAGWQTAVTAWAIVSPLGMSILVGLFFGLYPAYQAAHMDPVFALRHE